MTATIPMMMMKMVIVVTVMMREGRGRGFAGGFDGRRKATGILSARTQNVVVQSPEQRILKLQWRKAVIGFFLFPSTITAMASHYAVSNDQINGIFTTARNQRKNRIIPRLK